MTTTGKQLFTTLESDGTLTVEIAQSEFPDPTGNQVLVKMEAAPINPSDMGLLFGPADMTTARCEGPPDAPVVVADVPEKLLKSVSARLDHALPCGNEGAGVVVAAGASDVAQNLVGKTVAILGVSGKHIRIVVVAVVAVVHVVVVVMVFVVIEGGIGPSPCRRLSCASRAEVLRVGRAGRDPCAARPSLCTNRHLSRLRKNRVF